MASKPLARQSAPLVLPAWTAAGLLLLACIITRAIWFGDPAAGFDEQLYSLVGQRMLEGELPFVDIWDRKPLGLFALFALAHGIAGPGPMAYQLLALAFTFAGAMLVHALARPIADRTGALVAGAAYPVLMPLFGNHSGQSETFFVPLVLASLWLVTRNRTALSNRDAMLAMLLGGLALQVKYSALPMCGAIGLMALWRLHRQGADAGSLARRAAVFAALGIAPTALVFALYAAIGHGEAFWSANFLSFFSREGAGRWNDVIGIFFLPLALPALAGLWLAQRLARPADGALYACYCVFGLASLATVFLPGTIYRYYLAALVPGAILVALPFFAHRAVAARLAVLALFAAYASYYVAIPQTEKSQTNRAGIARLAEAIAPHVDRENCLFIFDGPSVLYAATDSCLPSRFAYPDHLNNALEVNALDIRQAAEVARILNLQPPVIVTASEPVTLQNEAASTLVEAAVARDYRALATARIDHRMITAWKRRD